MTAELITPPAAVGEDGRHLYTCPLCEAMCGLEIHVEGGRVRSIRGNRDDTWRHGHLCPRHDDDGNSGNSDIPGACIRAAAGAYARKMEPDPKETPDFSAFSKMRRIPLDPESVIGRELHDRFAEFDESFTGHSRIWSVVVKLIGLTAMCSKAVIDLEKQVIELRREVRSRDKE